MPVDVTVTPLTPDALDLDMFREMYRDGAVNLAGIDPRLNATRIAKRLKVGRARVAARLKAWTDSGFLRTYDVWLNPALFGWIGAWMNIQLDHPRSKASVYARLALIDGAISGTEVLGDWIQFGLVSPDAASLERTVDLIRGLTGVRTVDPPTLWIVPEPKRELTPLDLRIVRALRARPTATLGETARQVGISARTMTRRYAELVDHWAVWFVPVLDFRALSAPVVSVAVLVRPDVGIEKVLRRIERVYPLTLRFRGATAGPTLAPETHLFFVILHSSAHLEEFELFVSSVDGVAGLETSVMVRVHSFPAWFDRHLETLGHPRGRPTVTPPMGGDPRTGRASSESTKFKSAATVEGPRSTMARKTLTIRQDFWIKAPVNVVFRALTEPSELTKWFLGKAVLPHKRGEKYEFVWREGYHHEGRVLDFVRNRRFSLTWPGPPRGVTRATFTVRREGKGTRVAIRHSGYGKTDAWLEMYGGTQSGWAYFLTNLKSVLEFGHDLRDSDHGG